MVINILTSASGSPGVTTTAIGLTLHWPESCLLVDGDYQQAVLTGYLQGRHVTTNGLVHVMNAARISPQVRDAVWRQSIPLPEDDPDGRRRLLLPGLVSPQAATALHQSWLPIATALRDLDDAGIDIIVDLGRLTPSGIHPALLDVASQILLVTRPTLRAVGACHWAARQLVDQTNSLGAATKVALLMVRRPPISIANLRVPGEHDDREIEEFLPLKVARASVVYDPANAAYLSDGGTRGPKFARSSYAGSLAHLAQILAPRAAMKNGAAVRMRPNGSTLPERRPTGSDHRAAPAAGNPSQETR